MTNHQFIIPAGMPMRIAAHGRFFAVEFYSQPLEILLNNDRFPARIGLSLGPVEKGFTEVRFRNISSTEPNYVSVWSSVDPADFNFGQLEPKTLPTMFNEDIAAAGTAVFAGFYQQSVTGRWRRKEIILTNMDAAGYLTFREYILDSGSVAAALVSCGTLPPLQSLRFINDHQIVILNETAGAIRLRAKSDYYV